MMESITAVRDGTLKDRASPKGDDDTFIPVGEKGGDKATAVTLSSGDPPAIALKELKEQIEYDVTKNDVQELSLHKIETQRCEKSNRDASDIKNVNDDNDDYLVIIGGKLVLNEGDHIGNTEAEVEEFKIAQDIPEDFLEGFINTIILSELQQNDGTFSPEEIQAMDECESDIEVIENEDDGFNDARTNVAQEKLSVEEILLEWKAVNEEETSFCPAVISEGEVRDDEEIQGRLEATYTPIEAVNYGNGPGYDQSCPLEMSESQRRVDQEVQDIIEAANAQVKAENQLHHSRNWRALGSEELTGQVDHLFYQDDQLDYDNMVCQACSCSIEQCVCADLEEGGYQLVDQFDDAVQLPTFVDRAPEKLNDSCDGDIEDSCSQTDERDFRMANTNERADHRNERDDGRLHGRRNPRGYQQSNTKTEALQEPDIPLRKTRPFYGGYNQGYRNSQPQSFRGGRGQQPHGNRRPPPRLNRRRPNKLSKKQLMYLQKQADNGDLYAIARLISHQYAVEAEVKDVGYGLEVVMEMPCAKFRAYIENECQIRVRECIDHWQGMMEEEHQKFAEALAQVYKQKGEIQTLNKDLSDADTEVLEQKHLIDQLQEEINQMRGSKRRRSQVKKQRQKDKSGGERQNPRDQ